MPIQTMSDTRVRDVATKMFEAWSAALETGDARKVASLYAEDAVLLPTVSNLVRRSIPEIADYFERFLAGGPEGRILEDGAQIRGGLIEHSGLYRFTMTALPDCPMVDARFTFLYEEIDGAWKIVQHHSSAMPEG